MCSAIIWICARGDIATLPATGEARPDQDRSNPLAGSIDPVNPVYIYKIEQIHAVDAVANGESNRPRSALEIKKSEFCRRCGLVKDRFNIAPERTEGCLNCYPKRTTVYPGLLSL